MTPALVRWKRPSRARRIYGPLNDIAYKTYLDSSYTLSEEEEKAVSLVNFSLRLGQRKILTLPEVVVAGYNKEVGVELVHILGWMIPKLPTRTAEKRVAGLLEPEEPEEP